MPQVTQKEILNLTDLLNGHAAMIEKLALKRQQVQDHELRGIIERHLDVYRSHYDALTTVAGGNLPGARQTHYHPQVTVGGSWHQGFQAFEPVEPQTGARQLSDRTVAVGCLEMNKHHALMLTLGAIEAATPHVRRLLLDMARDHAEMAYELFAYMHKHHWYEVPGAQETLTHQVAQGFQPVGGGGYAGHQVRPGHQAGFVNTPNLPAHAGGR